MTTRDWEVVEHGPTSVALDFVHRFCAGQLPGALQRLDSRAQAVNAELLLRDAYRALTTRHGKVQTFRTRLTVPLRAPEEVRDLGLGPLAEIAARSPAWGAWVLDRATVEYDVIYLTSTWSRGKVGFQVLVLDDCVAGSGHWELVDDPLLRLSPTPTRTTAENAVARSTELVERLAEGAVEEVHRLFAPDLALLMPPSDIHDMWRQLTAQLGRFEKVLAAETFTPVGGAVIVAVLACELAESRLAARFLWQPDGRLAGLHLYRPHQGYYPAERPADSRAME